jgi:hypothetical protein
LAEAIEALFVYIDNDDRPLRRFARMQHLKEVEDADAKLVQQDGVSEAQGRKSEKQPEGEAPGKSKSLRQSCKPRH